MHFKRNNKETRNYLQGLRSFGKILPQGIKNILKKNGYNYSEIASKWNNLVGRDIANSSYPKSIQINSGSINATLILAVKRGNELLIEYSKKEIIDKINSYFGYRFINKIKLVSNNTEIKRKKNTHQLNQFSEKFEKKIKQIKNKNIKESLSKLINAIKDE